LPLDEKIRRDEISIYGGGGHARVVADILRAKEIRISPRYEDDIQLVQDSSNQFEAGVILKGRDHFSTPPNPIVLAIGSNQIRQKIADELVSFNVQYTHVIHPRAIVASSVSIGGGSVILANAVIQLGTVVGMHVIINTSASVDHECKIANFAHVSPNATLCGNVSVGEGAHIGAGATVIEGMRIGKWATVGAGAVVIRNVDDYETVVGCPAMPITNSKMKPEPINNLHLALLEIINSINRTTGRPERQTISKEQNLQADLKLDSLDLAELTVLLESKFGIDIFEDGMVSTVQDVLNKISTK
jgi:acyl carrier protein